MEYSTNEPVSSFSSLAKEDEAFGSPPIAAKAFCLVAGIVSGIILAACLKAYVTPFTTVAFQLPESRNEMSADASDIERARTRTSPRKKSVSPQVERKTLRSHAFANSMP